MPFTKVKIYICGKPYCPCQICRFKRPFCTTAISSKTCGDCVSCKQDFNDHALHHLAHHASCKFCEEFLKVFPQYLYTVLHQRTYESEQEERKSFLFQHIDTDTLQKESCVAPFSCDNCQTSFKRKADLKRHEVAQHFGSRYKCTTCGQNFPRYDNLLQHLGIVHDKVVKNSFQCEKCNELFPKKSSYQRHMVGSIDEKGNSRNICEICDAEFCTNKKLSKHRQGHTTYSCKHCLKSFSKKQSLNTHVATRKENPCPECDKILCNLSDFTSHCKTHNYEECSKCGNSYLKSYLPEHNLMNHTQSEESTVLCSLSDQGEGNGGWGYFACNL